MQALYLSAGTYLQKVQAKIEAFAVAAQNEPLTDMQVKSKELLLVLKVLLKEYCSDALRIGALVRDCNWAGRDPGSGKHALAVLRSCLLGPVSLVGDQWENVEYIKTLVAALSTWQRWHSQTPGCFLGKEFGEVMLNSSVHSANFGLPSHLLTALLYHWSKPGQGGRSCGSH